MADTTDLITEIRFFLGDLSTDLISDANMTIIIDKVKESYPDNDCDQLYYSTVRILEWLTRKAAVDSAGSGGGGALIKQTEKEGNVTFTEEYSSDTTTTTDWSTILDDLEADPSSIGCTITVDEDDTTGVVIIGTSSIKVLPPTELSRRCGGDRNINRHWNARNPYSN